MSESTSEHRSQSYPPVRDGAPGPPAGTVASIVGALALMTATVLMPALRRRTDWAWVGIPALAVVAVACCSLTAWGLREDRRSETKPSPEERLGLSLFVWASLSSVCHLCIAIFVGPYADTENTRFVATLALTGLMIVSWAYGLRPAPGGEKGRSLRSRAMSRLWALVLSAFLIDLLLR
jgi:hypothetical protein